MSDLVSNEGGFSLVLLVESVFFVPLSIWAMFYPAPGFAAIAALLLLNAAGFVALKRFSRP